MESQKKILVFMDFTDESYKTLDFAIQIAKKTEAKVDVVNLIQSSKPKGIRLPLTTSWGRRKNSIDSLFTYKLYRKNKKKLHAIKKAWSETEYVYDVSVLVSSDTKLATINNIVEQRDPLLLVMPYVPQSSVQRYITSNLTLDLIRNLKIPILCIPENNKVHEWKNIVFPSGFSDDVQPSFVELVNILNRSYQCKLHLIKVQDSNRDIQEEVEAHITSFAEKHELNNYIVNTIESKQVEKAIDIYQQSVRADLICMITKGKSGISQLFFSNSLTENILQKVKTPLLTLSTKN